MDSDNIDGLRRRRLAFYENSARNDLPISTHLAGSPAASTSHTQPTEDTTNADLPAAYSSNAAALVRDDSTDKSENTDNCTNENSENGSFIEDVSQVDTFTPSIEESTTVEETIQRAPLATAIAQLAGGGDNSTLEPKETEFRIKLKYLNDDLKLAKGSPSEPIGDFKKYFFFYFLFLQ